MSDERMPWPVSEAGTVILDSGRWDWVAASEPKGWRIHFRRQGGRLDEMLCLLTGSGISPADVEEAGRNPVHRHWEDDGGTVWRVSLEIDALPFQSRGLRGRGMLIVFRAGGRRVEAPVSGELPIGELTDAQLLALIRR